MSGLQSPKGQSDFLFFGFFPNRPKNAPLRLYPNELLQKRPMTYLCRESLFCLALHKHIDTVWTPNLDPPESGTASEH